MDVVLSTISRFHTFDAARQLLRHGVLERLFTGQLRRKTRNDGIPADRISCFPVVQAPYEAAARFGVAEWPLGRTLEQLAHVTHDAWVARNVPPCDVFSALVYGSRRSGEVARRRGAVWVCDAPTPHTQVMEDVLIEEHSRLGIPYRPKPRSMVEAEVAVYHAADHITVASTYARSTFIERGLHPDRISVIPYGVDLEQFSPRPGVSRNGFRVLFVGRLSVLKGVHYLVAAMRQANIRAGSLTLVGSVLPETEHLLAGTQDIDLDVHGPVARAALPDFFSQADVMVLPSLSDGFGLVIGQALACGCPVIATESTGGRDILRDGVNGFIVTSRSAAAIAEKLVWLHEHPAEREAMRARAVDSVRSVGGWDDYGDALVQLFARLSGERR